MEAKKIKEIYDFNKHKAADGKVNIVYYDGICAIDSTVEIMGLEIDFQGKVEITPTLPEGWILQGNNSKILIFTLQNRSIEKCVLFTYVGVVKLKTIIVANTQGRQISHSKAYVKPDFEKQNWDFTLQDSTWDSIKSLSASKKKVKKTIYHLPDYNLPKVKEVKKQKIETNYSMPSSRGTGGY